MEKCRACYLQKAIELATGSKLDLSKSLMNQSLQLCSCTYFCGTCYAFLQLKAAVLVKNEAKAGSKAKGAV